MFHWEKLGHVFDPATVEGLDWMKEYAQSPTVLVLDDRVRVFFCCRPLPGANGQQVSYAGWADLDRKDLTRVVAVSRAPALPLGELGTFDEFGTNPVSVIRHGDEVRLYYAGWTRCESVPFNAAIGVAVSDDQGTSFRRLGKGPVLSYTPDEPFVIGSPKIRKFGDTWHLWYASGRRWVRTGGRPEPVYKIREARSADGLEWARVGRDLIADRLDADECQASADVFHHAGVYHMFFSYRQNLDFKNRENGYRIGYASSADLSSWMRDDDQAGLAVSETGWDSEMVSYPHVFELDDTIYMLYQGNGIGKNGFGLARLK